MNDWRDKQVKDFGEIITGRTPSTARKDFYDGDYNLISPADLDNGKYIRTAHKTLTKLGFEQCRALPKGTVLVGCIGNVGKLGMVGNDESATNQQINALICNHEHDHEFVYYCFHENREKLEKRAVKTTVPILNKTNFGNFEVKVPPLPEQKKIAHILSTVQRAIEAQRRIIQTTTELKKALMHKLFTEGLPSIDASTGGLRHEPQKQTEIGPVPESWEVVKIKDHCIESAFGPRFGSELYAADGNILTLRTTDMEDDGRIDYNTAPLARIDYAKFEKHYLQVGDIVVSRSGTCGIASVFEGYSLPVLPGAFLIRLRMKESVQPMFLRHYINSPVGRPYVLQLAQGAIQKNISGTRLGDLLVPLPSRAEQDEISAAVGTVDQKLAIHRQKLTANQDLFRTLLHELMTAQIRVGKHVFCGKPENVSATLVNQNT